jgi:hypothetical protein
MNEIEVLWLGEGWNGLEKHDYVSLPVSEDNVEISYREQSEQCDKTYRRFEDFQNRPVTYLFPTKQ